MGEVSQLEALIRARVPLGRVSPQGFHAVKCAVCADYKERGGFKFEPDAIGYNCFNCGHAARYEAGSGHLSRAMRTVLHAFGLTAEDLDPLVAAAFFAPREEREVITAKALKAVSTVTLPTKLPPGSLRLGATQAHLAEQERLVRYLLARKVNLDRYPFFFSLADRYRDRVIIPFYRAGHLIFWQARAIDQAATPRYLSAPVARTAVLFNLDLLERPAPQPLFVTEGVFDAMMVDGLALAGSKLSAAKVELLRRSRRRLIFVIDKDQNGAALAQEVLQHGWELTFAPAGAADVNDAVVRFGLAWTAYQLARAACGGAEAKLAVALHCR
jgi:hypothetical protein